MTLSAPYVAAQRFFVELQRRGLLVCLVSRNEEADVRAVFEARAAEMPLPRRARRRRRGELAAQVGELARAARDLCLDVGSFVFVDDSPLECAEVHAALGGKGVAVVAAARGGRAARLPARVLGV